MRGRRGEDYDTTTKTIKVSETPATYVIIIITITVITIIVVYIDDGGVLLVEQTSHPSRCVRACVRESMGGGGSRRVYISSNGGSDILGARAATRVRTIHSRVTTITITTTTTTTTAAAKITTTRTRLLRR